MGPAVGTSAGSAGRSAEAAAERGACSDWLGFLLEDDCGDAAAPTAATATASWSLAPVAATADVDAWRDRGSGEDGQIALLVSLFTASLTSPGGRSLKFLGSVLKPAAAAESAEILGLTSTNP